MNTFCRNNLALALSVVASSSALAAGFQINPTASAVARSMGGNGIIGEDIGDMFYNPAAMMLVTGDSVLQLGANVLEIENKFVNQGSVSTLNLGPVRQVSPLNGSNKASNDFGTPIGGFYTRKAPWNEAIRLGISLTSPWGLSTTYEFDWLGRYHATSSELTVIDLNLNAAWDVSSSLSLGIGVSAQSADATLIQAVPDIASGTDLRVKVEGKDSAFGYNFGLLYRPNTEWKLGLSYRSKVSHDLDGYRRISSQGNPLSKIGAVAPLELPESVHLSVHYQPEGKPWSIAAGTRWTAWSRFDELRINYKDGSTSSVTPQNWNDSYTSGISMDYKLSNQDKLIFSIGYDETPVPSASERSAQVPEFDRRVIGFGYEKQSPFNLCENCQAYFGYHRTMVGDRAINNTNALNAAFSTTLTGYYKDGHVDVFAGHFQISF